MHRIWQVLRLCQLIHMQVALVTGGSLIHANLKHKEITGATMRLHMVKTWFGRRKLNQIIFNLSV